MVEAGRQYPVSPGGHHTDACRRKVGADPELRWIRARADAPGAGHGRCEPACATQDPEPERKGIMSSLMEKREERRSKA